MNRNRDSGGRADGLKFSEQDVENDAVHGVVAAVDCDRADDVMRLAEAVDSTLTLFVTRWVPREVVVDDRREVILKIYPFGEAVGGDQHDGAVVRGQLSDACTSQLGWKSTGDRCDARARPEGVRQVLSNVVGGVDEAAEDDR
jgi:hypothetical protein